MSQKAAEALDQYEKDDDDDKLQAAATALGWDEADYYEMCEYDEDDEAYYPQTELGAPRDDYSIVEHAIDFLRQMCGRPSIDEEAFGG